MYLVKNKVKCALLLATFFTAGAQSLINDNEENETMAQVEEVFDEIEENHHKLKQLIQDVVLKDRSGVDSGTCVCVPFYLCDINKGEIVKDGSYLLESRSNFNPCPTPQEICCEPYWVNVKNKANTPNFECGTSGNVPTENRDDNPTLSKFAEFPWTVTVSVKGGTYKCAGSLIHPQVVLTAAHCVNTTVIYKVRAGDWDVRSRSEPYRHQNEYVKTIIKHPNFNVVNLFYDVALLILENPFALDKNVNTACLTNSAPDLLNTISDQCAASGWGKLKGQYSPIMKKVGFSLLPHENCENVFRKTRLGNWFELHQSFTCACGQNGLDTCPGDGGGPLVCPILGSNLRYQQVGITSWGLECETNLPSVFTKVSQVKNWIDEQFNLLGYNQDYYTFKES